MSSILIYGRPGSGKTTMAASMTELGYKVHFIDVDGKIKNMQNLKQRIEDGSITSIEIESPVDPQSLKSRATAGLKAYPAKLPKGYHEIVSIIDEYSDSDALPEQPTVLVLDSLTRVNEHMKSLLKHYCHGKLDFSGWDAVLGNYEALFDAFYKLQPNYFKHCIIIAHAKDDKDEVLQVIESRPLIDGQFRDKAGAYVEEMFFTFVDVPTKSSEPKFLCYTKPTGRILHARSSRDLPVVVESDFSVIFEGEKVNGMEKSKPALSIKKGNFRSSKR